MNNVTEDDTDSVLHNIKVGLRSGSGQPFKLTQVADRVQLINLGWNPEYTTFQATVYITWDYYQDQFGFKAMLANGTIFYTTTACRITNTGMYAAFAHTAEALSAGIAHPQLYSQLLGESIADIYFSPQSTYNEPVA